MTNSGNDKKIVAMLLSLILRTRVEYSLWFLLFLTLIDIDIISLWKNHHIFKFKLCATYNAGDN